MKPIQGFDLVIGRLNFHEVRDFLSFHQDGIYKIGKSRLPNQLNCWGLTLSLNSHTKDELGGRILGNGIAFINLARLGVICYSWAAAEGRSGGHVSAAMIR